MLQFSSSNIVGFSLSFLMTQLENSSHWPEDLEAFYTAKEAFLLAIRDELLASSIVYSVEYVNMDSTTNSSHLSDDHDDIRNRLSWMRRLLWSSIPVESSVCGAGSLQFLLVACGGYLYRLHLSVDIEARILDTVGGWFCYFYLLFISLSSWSSYSISFFLSALFLAVRIPLLKCISILCS